MQLLGSDIVPNTVSRSPWGFESKSYEVAVKGGGKKSKVNRRNKSAKNKTRRRIYK